MQIRRVDNIQEVPDQPGLDFDPAPTLIQTTGQKDTDTQDRSALSDKFGRRHNDYLMSEIANRAGTLGYEVVEFASFTQELEERSKEQMSTLSNARTNADEVFSANNAIANVLDEMRGATGSATDLIKDSVALVQSASNHSNDVVEHVITMADQVTDVQNALKQVKTSNECISDIATKVNMLAINARIEASRAGESGAGFATIASAINELAATTAQTAKTISAGVDDLNQTLLRLAEDSKLVREKTDQVITGNAQADTALSQIATSMESLRGQTTEILNEAEKVRNATEAFAPAFAQIETSISDTSERIANVRDRTRDLVDITESIVQDTVSLGGRTADTEFIGRVQEDAAKVIEAFESALSTGKISDTELFSRNYKPIPGSMPEQVTAPFTNLTDQLLPTIQEAALSFSEKVVFCAAVNVDGYLPTHNRKFSKRQGNDATWNTANCRNRRIFDDRVGLKAGKNTRPFLLQVYRRDMGGGVFALMKDVSAPITVNGRHWGGLRLAYRA